MLAHFFFVVTMTNLSFILFCKLNENGMFCFSRNLAATLSFLLITSIITWNGYFSLLSNMYRLLYFGRKKSTLINYCFCSFQLSPFFFSSQFFFFFEKSWLKLLPLGFLNYFFCILLQFSNVIFRLLLQGTSLPIVLASS